MRAMLVFCSLAFAACATDAVDPALDPDTAAQDDEAEIGVAADSKADAATRTLGIYETHATTHKAGDLTALELRPAAGSAGITSYVRQRCYGTNCTLPLPETDRYDLYGSSAGKTYLRFYSFTVTRDADGDLNATPQVADVYELALTSTTIKLRKSYTTRWFSLYRTTAAKQCAGSRGAWSAADCACPRGQIFIPGAGGCITAPADSESNCDASNGLWADDDATLTGEYCACGFGRYDGAAGACVATP